MDKRVTDNKQSSDENKQKIDEIMKKIADIPTTKGDHSKIEKTIQVMKDEDSLKANIIVYNTEESDADDIKQRTKDDANFIQTMCEDMQVQGITNGNILQLVRLGKKEDGKKRPLLVKLDSVSTKMNLLRGTSNLKDAGEIYNNIGIDHDYTPAQRDEHKALVTEAKKKTADDQSGNYVYRVRGPPGQQRIRAIPTQ